MSGRPPLDPPRVYLVRHGRTAGNGRSYVGWMDLSLDDTGRAQAAQAARMLASQRVDRLHASDLQRALMTAAALQLAPEVEAHAALREINYGLYTGRSKDGLRLRLRRDHTVRALPEGECLADVDRRVRSYLQLHLRPALQAGASVVVVSHFWSLRLLLAALLGQTFAEAMATSVYKPGNGSVLAWTGGLAPATGAQGGGTFEAATRWLWRGDEDAATPGDDESPAP